MIIWDDGTVIKMGRWRKNKERRLLAGLYILRVHDSETVVGTASSVAPAKNTRHFHFSEQARGVRPRSLSHTLLHTHSPLPCTDD